MSRMSQRGEHAPRKGTLIRTSATGVAALTVPAIARFPPPDFLTDVQRNLWIAALSDVSLEFFRARHIPMMIQYVRTVERMMKYGDAFEEDPEDTVSLALWERMMRIASRLETHLSLSTKALTAIVTRARADHRAANELKRNIEAGEEDGDVRAGLVYVGH